MVRMSPFWGTPKRLRIRGSVSARGCGAGPQPRHRIVESGRREAGADHEALGDLLGGFRGDG
eukprot:2080038-Prymnesium_polylepis.1